MQFHYKMRLDFSNPVMEHHFTLKCLPQTNFRQEISSCQVKIDPEQELWRGQDQFGNVKLMGYLSGLHDHIYADVCGNAAVRFLKEPVSFGMIEPMKYPSPLTHAGPAVRRLLEEAEGRIAETTACLPAETAGRTAEAAGQTAENPKKGAGRSWNMALTLTLMNLIYQKMVYVPGETEIGTTAEEACESGRGVCQDYAHIMLAALRQRKIPCRYVCGMLAGVGESHAWVEAFDQGAWIGYDPTNNVLAGDRHLVISYGKDALDCRINQGVFIPEGGLLVSQDQRIVASVGQ